MDSPGLVVIPLLPCPWVKRLGEGDSRERGANPCEVSLRPAGDQELDPDQDKLSPRPRTDEMPLGQSTVSGDLSSQPRSQGQEEAATVATGA